MAERLDLISKCPHCGNKVFFVIKLVERSGNESHRGLHIAMFKNPEDLKRYVKKELFEMEEGRMMFDG